MSFEITAPFIDGLHEAVERNDHATVLACMDGLYPQDIAEILDAVSLDEAKYIFRVLPDDVAAEVLTELEDDTRERFLNAFSNEEIAKILPLIDSDDAADLMADLSEERQDEVLEQVTDSELVSDIEDLLTYQEGTAGALMAKELIKVNINWSILRCVREMRLQAEEVDEVYTVYVVDDDNVFQGIVSLKRMLISPDRAAIRDIFNPEAISVLTHDQGEEVAQLMEKYNLVVVPVLDRSGHLLGRITVDDVMDLVREEATKDYQMLSGISENIELTDSPWVMARARLPWLLIALLGGIVGSQVIGLFEEELRVNPNMAFFIPLIAAMGGNVGIQSSALVVQGIANGTLGDQSLLLKLLKELAVGLLNGLVCASVLLLYSLLMHNPIELSLTVGTALMVVILFAAVFGTFVPVTLNRFGIDPALSTGPFITTTNDIVGLFFYFTIGRLMYGVQF